MLSTLISLAVFGARFCFADAAPVGQSLLQSPNTPTIKANVFRLSIQDFSGQVASMKSVLNSSGACPAYKKLPAFHREFKSFKSSVYDWVKPSHLIPSCSVADGLNHKSTQLFKLEVEQLGNELSVALDSKPADITEVCSENAHLQLLNLNLDQFANRMASYDAYLHTVMQNGPCLTSTNALPVETLTEPTPTNFDFTKTTVTATGAGVANFASSSTEDLSFTAATTIPTRTDPLYGSGHGEEYSSTVSATITSSPSSSAVYDSMSSSDCTSNSPSRPELPTRDTSTSSQIFVDTSSPTTSATSATPAAYNFNQAASNNVAVYYGQTTLTGSTSLSDQCADPNIDIVLLAFLNNFTSASGFPTIDFGPACKGQTQEQIATAPGLLSCPALAADILACQNMGKKVLLSLGGAVAQSSFADDGAAVTFAQQIWDLFGGGTNYSNDLRPFGAVQIDGFDFDNESTIQTGYTTLAQHLRTLFATYTTKTYYLAAAPQCVFPDASIPLSTLAYLDFIFVQFYNNACAFSATDSSTSASIINSFPSTLRSWSSTLASLNSQAKIYIGLLGWDGSGNGYVDPGALASGMGDVLGLGLQNLGGVMLWDGPMSRANVDMQSGWSYVRAVKESLQGGSP